MVARASGVKSAYCNELPIRQHIPDRNSKPRVKSHVKANIRNPTAIFSDVRASSSVRQPSCRATPAESRTSGKNGTTFGGTSAAGGKSRPMGGQSAAVGRQRSPWRPADDKCVRQRSDTEVGACKRRPSVSPVPQRRPADRTSTSATKVRRTRSVPVTSITPGPGNCSDNCDDLPKTPPVAEEPSSRGRSRSPRETEPAGRSLSRLPRPVVEVHSAKQAPATPDDKPTECMPHIIVQAVKSAWNQVWKVESAVLTALLFIVIVVVGGCAYACVNITPAPPSPSPEVLPPPQLLQPSHETPVSPSLSDGIWAWFQYADAA